jgi:hypothetical protein
MVSIRTRRVRSISNGVLMPHDFPTRLHDIVTARVETLPGRPPHKWQQFGPSWSAVALRFFGAALADDALRRSLDNFGTAPPPGPRTGQELALFSFLTNSCAAVESFTFALFAIGWIIDPITFDLRTEDQRKHVTVKSTVAGLQRRFPREEIVGVLGSLIGSESWDELLTWRNVVSHQAAPGRLIKPANMETDWRVGLHRGRSEDIRLITPAKRRWLADTLLQLTIATSDFLVDKAAFEYPKAIVVAGHVGESARGSMKLP